MKPEYISEKYGFIGCYTKDKNRPYMCCNIFLVYDFDKGIGLYNVFSKFDNFQTSYCIFINTVCKYVYSFKMSKDGLGKDVVYEYQTALRGLIPYKKESAISLLSFWSLDKEVSDAILENKGSFKFEEREIPEEDFRKSFYEIVPEEYMGLIITKKTDS